MPVDTADGEYLSHRSPSTRVSRKVCRSPSYRTRTRSKSVGDAIYAVPPMYSREVPIDCHCIVHLVERRWFSYKRISQCWFDKVVHATTRTRNNHGSQEFAIFIFASFLLRFQFLLHIKCSDIGSLTDENALQRRLPLRQSNIRYIYLHYAGVILDSRVSFLKSTS